LTVLQMVTWMHDCNIVLFYTGKWLIVL
jgi:hypothetical protein